MSERFEGVWADRTCPRVLVPGSAYGSEEELGPDAWGLQLGNPFATALMVVGTRAQLATMLQQALFLLVATGPANRVRFCARCAHPITDPENAPAGDDALCVLCGDDGPCCWQLPDGQHSPACPHHCWDCGGGIDGPDACGCGGDQPISGDGGVSTLAPAGPRDAPRDAVSSEQVR